MHELRGERELTLPEALRRLSPCDLVLVEGYKSQPIPKLEVWRPSVRKPLLHADDPAIRGIATDDLPALGTVQLPVFRLDAVDEIATFILREAQLIPVSD
jgi:molybdopterin-guanine dinucleotide biosynthesis protein B